MSQYLIEDNIPIPRPRCGTGMKQPGPRSAFTQAVNALEPGQSVLTDDYADFRAADQFVMRQKPRKFAIRKIPRQGWRVWRVE